MPSTSKGNMEQSTSKYSNASKNYQSITIVSDDDLEDGEIIENNSINYDNVMAESYSAILRSKRICADISSNQPLFYIDKSADSDMINLPNRSENAIEIDDSVIILNSTQSDSDSSVIFVDENEPSTSNIPEDSDFISLSPIVTDTSKMQISAQSKINRKERQKARFKLYKKMKEAKKILDLQSNNSVTKNQNKIIPNKSSVQTSTPKSKNITEPNVTTLQIDSSANSTTISDTRNKRIILIDGSNVALGFTSSSIGKKAMVNDSKNFSAEALKIAISYFEDKGFQVKAVIPEYRVRREKSSNHELMVEMHDNGKLITTPAKSYDDLILWESAVKLDAAIVSNDKFRDIRQMKKEFNNEIEKRQIRYNWVFQEFILATDPNGRTGPQLDDILYKKS